MKTKYYKHPITGKIVEMESGFNLAALLFGCIYLFIKGDIETGSILFVIGILGVFFPPLLLLSAIANIWVAVKWNKDYAEHLIEKGYKIIEFPI